MSLEIMFLDVLAKKKEFILAHKNNISSEGQPPVVILVPDINIETRKVMWIFSLVLWGNYRDLQ